MPRGLNRGDGEVTVCGSEWLRNLAELRFGKERGDIAQRLNQVADTIEALVEALGSLVDQDLQFDGESIVIRCGSHGAAIERARKARSALSLVRRGK